MSMQMPRTKYQRRTVDDELDGLVEDGVSAIALEGDAAQVMKDDCARYEDRIHSELQRLQTHIDSTMYDGGTALENFEEMFGTKKYYELLEGFLRP